MVKIYKFRLPLIIAGDVLSFASIRHLSVNILELFKAAITLGSFSSVLTGSPILNLEDFEILPFKIEFADANVPSDEAIELIFSARSFFIFSSFLSSSCFLILSLSVVGSEIFTLLLFISASISASDTVISFLYLFLSSSVLKNEY